MILQISQGKFKVGLDVYSPSLKMKLMFGSLKGFRSQTLVTFLVILKTLG